MYLNGCPPTSTAASTTYCLIAGSRRKARNDQRWLTGNRWPLTVYRPRYNASGLWVRPHAMFFGDVEIDGQRVRRFAPVSGSD